MNKDNVIKKKKETLPFTTWMKLEGIMLSEDKVKYCMKIKIKKILYEITCMWNLKHRHRHTHTAELIGTENRLVILRISGDGGGSL